LEIMHSHGHDHVFMHSHRHAGSPRNPSGSVQAWRSRLPALSTPDKATGCMDVLVTRELLLSTRDIASYVDISNADIRSFVQANADRFGGTKEFRYKFDSRLSASEMIRSVTVANAQTVLARRVARGRSSSVPGAHFTCSSYDAKGVETNVKCMGTTEADYAACAKNGTVACALVYHDVNVVAKPRPGVFRRLCLEAWKRENDPASFLQLYNLVKPDASGQSYTVDRVATEALALDLLLSLADPDWGRRLNLTERNTLSSCGAGEDVVNTEFETGCGCAAATHKLTDHAACFSVVICCRCTCVADAQLRLAHHAATVLKPRPTCLVCPLRCSTIQIRTAGALCAFM
jgi:hypothetical protein